MKVYLDIIALINSDFYKKNQRLSWHMNNVEYDKFNLSLSDLFEKIKFDKTYDEIFQLAKTSIHKSVSIYLSHVYDYVMLSSNYIQPVYSSENKIYLDIIWKKKKLPIVPSIEQNNKAYKKSILKKTYQIITENIPKNLFKYIVASRNPLIKDFLTNNYKYLKISHPIYLSHYKSGSKTSKMLSQKISTLIFSMIEKKYFNLKDEHKQSINFIIERHLSEADSDLKNYDGFLKNSKNIIFGTSTGYYTRLISTIAKNHNINVWKFDHGGEKCFFDDHWYWNSAFYNTNVFVTYGKKWKEYLEKKAKYFNKQIEVKAFGSSYHKKIFNTDFGKKLNNKKILYIPTSFLSEERELRYGTIIDPVYYDWQKYLIETLQKLQYEVIYKVHPNGKYQGDSNLGSIAKYKNTDPMIESLRHVDIVILDNAGSAFVEALCAGKDVIYVDMKQRPFNRANFEELNSVVKIVPANQLKGIFYIEEEKLMNALNSPQKNIDKQRKLVKEYWLESA
jgi:hypothetical protein